MKEKCVAPPSLPSSRARADAALPTRFADIYSSSGAAAFDKAIDGTDRIHPFTLLVANHTTRASSSSLSSCARPPSPPLTSALLSLCNSRPSSTRAALPYRGSRSCRRRAAPQVPRVVGPHDSRRRARQHLLRPRPHLGRPSVAGRPCARHGDEQPVLPVVVRRARGREVGDAGGLSASLSLSPLSCATERC